MESLVGINFEHLTRTLVIPVRHHYGVDDHRIVLLLDAQYGQRWRHLIFRRALGAVTLIVTLIDDLHGRIRSNYLVDLEVNSIPIGCKDEETKQIKNSSDMIAGWSEIEKKN